ncbi:MAG: NAD(P)/FAD-dependent oxidoreductase, partial [Coriobacteriales bacterium]|nr:NAD(P)/FAD-dependent oxidoreductase [Coriobacteriales bacterium]
MSEIRRYDVAVLGGGAAGLCAAIAAARVGARVVVVEREQRLGQKILATGNGRCNLSNATIGAAGATAEAGAATAAMIDAAAVAGGAGAAAAYNHPDFVKPLLEAFPFAVIRAFFEELGLLLVVEDNGWAYPRSRRANSVLGVLLNALEVPGVEVLTAYRAGLEVLSGGGYRLFNEDADAQRSKDDIGLSRGNNSSGAPAGGNDDIIARAVVIASGRPPQTRGLKALRLREPVAVLGPLGVSPAQIKGLDGVRTQCRVSLIRRGAPAPIVAESGELLFRKKAVSGIVIFNLSRWARPGDRLSIDLFSEYTHLQLESLLIRLHQHLPASLAADDFLVGLLHRRLALTVLRLSGVNPNLPFVRERILRTAEVAKDL